MPPIKKSGPSLQGYPRIENALLSKESLFPLPKNPLPTEQMEEIIDRAFQRCLKNKKGEEKEIPDSPEALVRICIRHLKERSDPILSSYFVSQLKAEDLYELDAVSYEMQRHRMTIGIFYQYLILELMKKKFHAFDGSREGDVVADIDDPPEFSPGLRIYMSIKKSKDTVGGQDIGGVIRRIEAAAKEEKNLTRPYLCVIGIATPSKGLLQGYNDRSIKCDNKGSPYSMNCEVWGPGFIFPYLSGWSPMAIYLTAIRRVSSYLPFRSLKNRKECSILLKNELEKLDLLGADGKIDQNKFLAFVVKEKKWA